jgi:hypothetical protein
MEESERLNLVLYEASQIVFHIYRHKDSLWLRTTHDTRGNGWLEPIRLTQRNFRRLLNRYYKFSGETTATVLYRGDKDAIDWLDNYNEPDKFLLRRKYGDRIVYYRESPERVRSVVADPRIIILKIKKIILMIFFL